MAIKAITFDLWDTLIDDDSDEAKRKAQGLRSKYDERRHLVWEALNAIEPIEMETVRLKPSGWPMPPPTPPSTPSGMISTSPGRSPTG
jgi:FMN phosphatase YigB (HAD superfamily)